MHKQELYDFLKFNKTEWILLLCLASINAGILILRHAQRPIIVLKERSTDSVDSSLLELQDELNLTHRSSSFSPSIATSKRRSLHAKFPAKNTENKLQFHRRTTRGTMSRQSTPLVFQFDPNRISYDSLRMLGLSGYTANNWVKYRNSGGKFYDPSDVFKIYGIDSSLAKDLLSLIVLPASKKHSIHKNQSSRNTSVNINLADQNEWQSIKVIGPYYSRKIIQYRKKLRGFSSIAQVRETPNLPDSVFLKIKPYLHLKQSPKPIDINEAGFIDLLKHPYFNTKQSKLITRYKKQHGPFNSMNDLHKIKGLDSEWIHKIRPYFYVKDNAITGLK